MTRPDYLRHQARTGAKASRYAEPWTPEQDRYLLLETTRTVAQRAEDLGRTYWAARERLRTLRELLSQAATQ
jgi:hypothetical protein